MDNITHSMVGAVLAGAGLGKKSALATPALLLAANLPDIDILGWVVGQNYLDFHRGITHSVPGAAVLSIALAATLWAGSRIFERDPAKRVRALPMLGICLIGVLSNPALDLLNDYGSRPWLPLSNRWYYGDLLGIVDIWLWGLFAAALFVCHSNRGIRITLAAFGLMAGGVVLLAGGPVLATAWLAVLIAALALSRLLRRRGFNPARIALALALAYLGGLYAARQRVLSAAQEAAPGLIGKSLARLDVLPGPPGSFGRWTVILQTPETYYIGESGLRSWHSHPPSFEVFQKNLDQPAYQRALSQSQMAAMARFARFPCVTVERSGTSCTVRLSDLRWARHSRDGWGSARAEVPLGKEDPESR